MADIRFSCGGEKLEAGHAGLPPGQNRSKEPTPARKRNRKRNKNQKRNDER